MTTLDHKPSAGHDAPSAAAKSQGGRAPAIQKKTAAIDAARQHPPTWRVLLKRAIPLAVAGAAIYVLFPAITKVLGAWPRLTTLDPIWFSVALAAEVASFGCNFGLQRLALRAKGWFAVVTAGLAGNSVTDSLPGGSAISAGVQFQMLATAGFDTDTAVSGLAAISFIGVAALLGLPLFAAPAMIAGIRVSPGLAHAALLGLAGFVLFAGLGALVLTTDRPLATAGRVAQKAWNWLTRGRHPVTGLDGELADRDAIRTGTRRALAEGAATDHRTAGLRLRMPAGGAARHHQLPPQRPRWYCWRTPPQAFSPSSRSPRAGSASSRRA